MINRIDNSNTCIKFNRNNKHNLNNLSFNAIIRIDEMYINDEFAYVYVYNNKDMIKNAMGEVPHILKTALNILSEVLSGIRHPDYEKINARHPNGQEIRKYFAKNISAYPKPKRLIETWFDEKTGYGFVFTRQHAEKMQDYNKELIEAQNDTKKIKNITSKIHKLIKSYDNVTMKLFFKNHNNNYNLKELELEKIST